MRSCRGQARERRIRLPGGRLRVAAQRELSDRTRIWRKSGAGIKRRGRRPAGRPALAVTERTSRSSRRRRPKKSRAIRRRCGSAVQELAQAVEESARAAKAAGVDDSAFQNRLREVQELLAAALTPELEQRLRRAAGSASRVSIPKRPARPCNGLAEAQQELRRELERSQELFKRAALEGELASLAKDAEDLQRRQTEWTREDAFSVPTARLAALSVISPRPPIRWPKGWNVPAKRFR